MFTLFMTGKKIILSAGTEHVRVVVPPPKTPARNHIEPRCPTIQFSPLVSSCGFLEVGIESAHCHHLALNVLKDSESANAVFNGMMNPKPIATIVMNCLVFFMTSPVWTAR